MKVIRIERLLVPSSAKIKGVMGYTVSNNYRLFFDDGTYHDQNYITLSDIKHSKYLNKVVKFSDNEGTA